MAPQRIGRTEKLVGVDVIAVHRMLKNDVPASEYLLMSEPLYESAWSRRSAIAQFVSVGLGLRAFPSVLGFRLRTWKPSRM